MSLIAGCSNEATTDTSNENEDSEEVARLKEENEKLKRQQAEQEKENEQQEEGEADSKEKSETKSESEENEQEDDSNESSTNENEQQDDSAFTFDINSDEVKNQLLGTSGSTQKGEFNQDAIQIGMSQSDIEESYGSYDFIFPSSGGMVTVYGNLAVYYSGRTAYGNDSDDGSSKDIDPSENTVELVYYYADVTPDELINAWGEPDIHKEDADNGPPFYSYHGETDNGKYYVTSASKQNTSQGVKIGIVSREIIDQNPDNLSQSSTQNGASGDRYFDEYYTEGFPVTLTREKDFFTYDTLQNFIFKTYLNNLQDYYNDKEDELLTITTGSALEQVQANKASGNFSDYQTLGGYLLSVEQISEREYRITVERSYSHATSDGEQTTQVTYTVVDTDGMLKVSEFN